MLRKLKRYLVGEDSETLAVSLVDEPAICEHFMFFKKEEGEKLEVALESDDKHLVAGAIIVPNRPIYRYDGEEEFFIEFSRETIEKMEQDFLKNFRQHNATVQHETEVSDVYMVESWLKSDMDYDKSIALGLNPNLEVGTWFAIFKVENEEVWNRVKAGELRGFSIESMISLEELDFSKVEKPVELEEQPSPAPEPQPEPAPVVEEPQPVVEEPVAEPAPVVEPAPEPAIEEPKAEPQPSPLEELIKNLQSEIESLKQTNADLVGKVNDLNKQPSVKPINPVGGTGNAGDTYSAWREQMSRML